MLVVPVLDEKLALALAATSGADGARTAEASAAWEHHEDINTLLDELHAQGYTIAALEQSPASISLPAYRPTEKTALLIGREVEGIDPNLLSRCDIILEIPQYGEKESLNVVQATAIALYHLRTVRETSDPL